MVLFAAGCLDAPPEAVSDPDRAALVLTGVAGDDNLTLDGQHELVIVGIHRNGDAEQPVAVVLFSSDTGIESAVAGGAVVELEFEPIDIAFTRRQDVTGLAILLGPGGELVAIDQDLASEQIHIVDADGQAAPPFDHVATLQSAPDERLVLSHMGEVWITGQLGSEISLANLPAWPVKSGDQIDQLAGVDSASSNAVAAVTGAGDIDTSIVVEGDPPALAPDLVGEAIPAPLDPVVWHGSSHGFVYLIGVQPQRARDLLASDLGRRGGEHVRSRARRPLRRHPRHPGQDRRPLRARPRGPGRARRRHVRRGVQQSARFDDGFDIGTPAIFEIPDDLAPPGSANLSALLPL